MSCKVVDLNQKLASPLLANHCSAALGGTTRMLSFSVPLKQERLAKTGSPVILRIVFPIWSALSLCRNEPGAGIGPFGVGK